MLTPEHKQRLEQATEVLNAVETLPESIVMTDACDRIKVLRDKWWTVYRSTPESVRDPKFMKGMDAAAGQILLELATFSIEQPKEQNK